MTISITTKTGDQGTSSLANGDRLPKNDALFEVVGTLDELNSWLGLVVVDLKELQPDVVPFLEVVQTTLFHIGAEIARSPKTKLANSHLSQLESEAKKLEKKMEDSWHTEFLLPGGTRAGAHLDLARTVCRRCERIIVNYHQSTALSPLILKYVNRLSDYLYLLRCLVNHQLHYPEKKFHVQVK